MAHPSPYRRFGLLAAALALAAVLVLIVFLGVNWYLAWLIGWSLVALYLYWWDKRRAVRGGERVPELVLHGVALVGGVLGAWVGRYAFRHKTQKASFTIVLVVATVLNAAFAWWLLVIR